MLKTVTLRMCISENPFRVLSLVQNHNSQICSAHIFALLKNQLIKQKSFTRVWSIWKWKLKLTLSFPRFLASRDDICKFCLASWTVKVIFQKSLLLSICWKYSLYFPVEVAKYLVFQWHPWLIHSWDILSMS